MKCNRCNIFNPEGFRFCASCGRALLYKPSKPLISPKSTTWEINISQPKKKAGWLPNWLSGSKT
jgi:hypothetical protein